MNKYIYIILIKIKYFLVFLIFIKRAESFLLAYITNYYSSVILINGVNKAERSI